AMLSLPDSTLKTLKRGRLDELADDANYTGSSDTNVMLSPDEQYIAFDLFRPSDQGDRDIFFMRLSDGRETPAVVHHADDAVCGWTRDGPNVLFVSQRTGEYALRA